MTPEATNPRVCSFCSRSVETWLFIPRFGGHSCVPCSVRLGRLLVDSPDSLIGVWPILVEEDDDEPEPKVTLADGRSVELRERTAELKKELPLEDRLKLAYSYGEIGLHREQILEAAFVLSSEPQVEVAQIAMTLLMENRYTVKDAPVRLRTALFPG